MKKFLECQENVSLWIPHSLSALISFLLASLRSVVVHCPCHTHRIRTSTSSSGSLQCLAGSLVLQASDLQRQVWIDSRSGFISTISVSFRKQILVRLVNEAITCAWLQPIYGVVVATLKFWREGTTACAYLSYPYDFWNLLSSFWVGLPIMHLKFSRF